VGTEARCTLYIVRRTQLYLDDQLWGALHARARREKTTVSELVRQAVRERYLGDREQRRAAMQEFVGIRKVDSASADSTEEVRRVRRGSRLDRLSEQ
jgi:metal-responsive CopG/Arc/MetJ family transcriptional regulator